MKTLKVLTVDSGVTNTLNEYVATSPFSATTRMLTLLSPSCRFVVPLTVTVDKLSAATAATKTDVVRGATVNEPPLAIDDAFTVKVESLVFEDNGVTNKVTV